MNISTRVKGEDGTTYIVRVYAEERTDGTWAGLIEFHPTDQRKPVLRSGQETSQPNRIAIEYWTLGLEQIYFGRPRSRASVKNENARLAGFGITRVTTYAPEPTGKAMSPILSNNYLIYENDARGRVGPSFRTAQAGFSRQPILAHASFSTRLPIAFEQPAIKTVKTIDPVTPVRQFPVCGVKAVAVGKNGSSPAHTGPMKSVDKMPAKGLASCV